MDQFVSRLDEDVLEKFCAESSFEYCCDVTQRDSLAGIFPPAEGRCGIYLLELDDGSFYIGQSVDVVRRFREHLQRFQGIARLHFRPAQRDALNDLEREIIHRAEAMGMSLKNIEFAAVVIGTTELDALLDAQLQQQWIAGGVVEVQSDGRAITRAESKTQRSRMQSKYDAIKESPLYKTVKQLLAAYLRKTILLPAVTESAYWSLSCLPSTNAGVAPRLACINIRDMETFVLGYQPSNPEQLWGYINFSGKQFREQASPFLFGFRNRAMWPRRSNYKSPGIDPLTIDFGSSRNCERLLADEAVCCAARALNLHLMRKGRTLFSRYHCFQLADDVIDVCD